MIAYGRVNGGEKRISNAEYLATIPETDSWHEVILECDRLLSVIDPNYQISQIKSKFGGLRYYFNSEYEHMGDRRKIMAMIVRDAECKIGYLEEDVNG